MTEAEQIIDIRDGQTGDIPFVLATMLRSAYYDNSYYRQMPKHLFMTHFKNRVAVLMAAGAQLKVAVLKEDPDIIIGYSLLSSDFHTVHFVYIRKPWRGNKISRKLVPARVSNVTFLTNFGSKLFHKLEHCIFNPFL